MPAKNIPVRTPVAIEELGNPQRRLSQRHRTVLLLIDGQRREEEVREMAIRAGSPATCFDELLDMGMIALPRPSRKMVYANSQAMPLTVLAVGDSEPPQDN
jgi:hypothetical protein